MAKGVEVYKGKVRIWFMWQGKRRYETTTFKPSPAGIASAGKLRATIQEEIRQGTFAYGTHFPDSRHAATDTSSFFVMAKRYVGLIEQSLSASTVYGYRNDINRYWLPCFGDRPMQKITTPEIRDAITDSGLSKLSAKKFNNAMTPLRGIFDLWLEEDENIDRRNPCDRIKFQKFQIPSPEPLSIREIELVLAEMDPRWLSYYEFFLGTGMRQSELFALRWSDVDWHMNTVTVERAFTRKTLKATKTGKVRHVELTPLAHRGLSRQKPVTFMKNGYIFEWRGSMIDDDKAPRRAWDAAIRKAGIRHRKAYSCRATYISHSLMAGINPYRVADQAGNSVETIMKHYAKWIKEAPASVTDIYGAIEDKNATKMLSSGTIGTVSKLKG